MKRVIAIFLFLITITTPILTYAENDTAKEKLVSVPESMLTEDQKSKLNQESAKGWVGLGREIGEAIDSSLGALTKNAEDFSETKVGIFTMCIVAYKVIGTDIIQLIIGLPLLIVLTIFWIIWYRKTFISRNVVIEIESDGLLKRKRKRYKYVECDKSGEYIFAAWCILAVIIGVCSLIIFP